MANWELQLLSRVIRTGNLSETQEWGIGADDFLTSEGRALYNALTGYYSQNGTVGAVIGANAASLLFPNFEICDDQGMTTESLCREVRRVRLIVDGREKLQHALNAIERDPLEAAQRMQTAGNDLMSLGYNKSTDIRFTSALDHIISKYNMREQGHDMSRGKWPWEEVNRLIGGINDDDYVVFYGRPKSFKSWVLAYIIAHMWQEERRCLVYTKEMSWENIFMRVAACICQLRYWNLRMGKLSDIEKKQLNAVRDMLSMFRESERLICLSGQDVSANGDNVPWLCSKVEHYKPEFVFIDGLYLMSDARGAKKREERISNISRDLRQMTLRYKVPIIATLQANRKAAEHHEANLDEIAYADAIGQDATYIFRVINNKPTAENPEEKTVSVVAGGAREVQIDGFRINAYPATDFSFHSMMNALDIIRATENDDKIASAKKNGVHKKPPTEAGAVTAALKRADKMI